MSKYNAGVKLFSVTTHSEMMVHMGKIIAVNPKPVCDFLDQKDAVDYVKWRYGGEGKSPSFATIEEYIVGILG